MSVSYTAGSFSVSVSSSSNDYLVASLVTLTCEVGAGAVGPVTYLWTSTCSGECFIAGQTSATVSTSALKAADSGSHTCTVTDSVGSTGTGSIEFVATGGKDAFLSGAPIIAAVIPGIVGIDNNRKTRPTVYT